MEGSCYALPGAQFLSVDGQLCLEANHQHACVRAIMSDIMRSPLSILCLTPYEEEALLLAAAFVRQPMQVETAQCPIFCSLLLTES